ncbi:cohesin-loading factor complex subunit [Maudiozyma humilis]|uniref:Sister chromatid cohesion protein n=1 Tax=Maudiozyma humilis TaxID=51915 RepID=A0AAV5S2H7_MAUHU|nr:cohesin-loading factor complex subunit [Kazachstania humilis]
MANFPGEDDPTIPKRMINAINKQPLSHLIPKESLNSLINEQLHASICLNNSIQELSSNESLMTNTTKDENSNKYSLLLDEKLSLRFNCPTNISLSGPETNSLSDDKLAMLSATTQEYITKRGIHVDEKDLIIPTETSSNNNGKKRRRDSDSDESQPDDIDSSFVKKTNISANVSLNQENIGLQYLKDFNVLMNKISGNNEIEKCNNMEYWYPLANETFLLNEYSLNKLLFILKNISSIPQAWTKLNTDTLLELLNIMTDNILEVRDNVNLDYDSELLKGVAYLSINVMFSIFKFNLDDPRLYMEKFVLEPVNFLTENLNLTDFKFNTKSEEYLQLFDSAIEAIPSYINNRPFIDDGLSTRLIYIFSEIMMCDITFPNNEVAVENTWASIKWTSSMILISLFEKVPAQREFIFDELLSHIEKLPPKRIQKKLIKIGGNTYISYFTLTIIIMLEKINYYQLLNSIVISDKSAIQTLKHHKTITEEELTKLIDHTIDFVINRLYENLIKYRHCLENIVQDLLSALISCQYLVSERILTALTKKMIGLFRPTKKPNANIETTLLQQLGQIGGVLFDIKSQTKSNQSNNLIKLCNYPDMLSQWLSSFQNVLIFAKSMDDEISSWNYAYCLQIDSLLELYEQMKDSNTSNTESESFIVKCLEDSLNSRFENHRCNLTYDVVKYDYFSILHSFELLGQYEFYLKLVLSILDEDKIKLRSVAIKSLSILVSKDDKILSDPLVEGTLTDLLAAKSAASVKDAILDLFSVNSAYLTFYKVINLNFDSDSLQVRRHVLKINEKIYDETDQIDVKVFVCSKILQRVEDEEDSIIDMAREILVHKWINDVNKVENTHHVKADLLKENVLVMSGVIFENEKCASIFNWFFNFYLLNSSLHTEQTFRNILKCMRLLTDILVQNIIELQADGTSEINPQLKSQLLNLLSVFSDAVVLFITKDHIMSLYPYMVSDTRSELFYHILHVFRSSIVKLTNFKPKFLFDLETTLLTDLPKMTVREIDEAVPLVLSVAQKRQDLGRIAKACSSCFKHLNPYIATANKTPNGLKLDTKLQRLLYLATAFARFTSFDTSIIHISYVKDGEPVYEYVAKCLLLLSKHEVNHVIRRIAIKNLTKLCGNKPRLFNSKHILSILDEVFKGEDTDIQLVILESFYDFFVQEEKHTVRESGESTFTSRDQHVKKDVQKEVLSDGICTALVARYLKNILKICRLPNFKNALVGIRLLRLILENGYTNPSLCVPTVISLLSSTSIYISRIALKMFTPLMEKYESMVYSGITKGVLLSVQYLRGISSELFYERDKSIRLLQDNMTTNRGLFTKFNKHINKVIQGIFNQFLADPESDTAKCNVLFLVANLPNIKYTNQYEVVKLIKYCELISEQIKEVLVDADGVNIDMMDSDDDEDSFSKMQNCVVCSKVIAELKTYLMEIYGITTEELLYEGSDETDLKDVAAVIVKVIPQPFHIFITDTIASYSSQEEVQEYLETLA